MNYSLLLIIVVVIELNGSLGIEWGMIKFHVEHVAFLVTSLLSVRLGGCFIPPFPKKNVSSSAKNFLTEDVINLIIFFYAQVCTFRLIVKNAASLLGKKDPVKLEAEALLDNLIRYPLSSIYILLPTASISVHQILHFFNPYGSKHLHC
jgi:hypothetical protein